MGIFDSLIRSALGGSQGLQEGAPQNETLLSKIVSELLSHPQLGQGLSGMVRQFEQKGLGDIMHSWVGTGSNLPISSAQIQQVLGSGVVQQLAGRVGISPEQLSGLLSQFLPEAVDRITPDGQVPDNEEAKKRIGALFQQSHPAEPAEDPEPEGRRNDGPQTGR